MTRAKKSISILFSFILMISMLTGAVHSASAASYKTLNGTLNYSYASEVLKLVNQERQENGLKPVVMTQSLTDGAMLRAAESAVSFSHTRPNGEQCFTAFSWTKAAGENIAYGQRTPQQVMKGWMNSSGHRANILSSQFTTIGIGCFEYNGTYYWAQAFSGGSGTAYAPSGTQTVSVSVSLTAGQPSVITNGNTEKEVVAAPPKETTTNVAAPAASVKRRSIIKRIRYYFRRR